MALGIELERKRDAAQMSAAAMSFVLDHEGHKKFLRVATNQELEAENTTLKARVQELESEVDGYAEANLKLRIELDRHQQAGIHLFAELERIQKALGAALSGQ